MTTLPTWEATLWNVDWSSREESKIFKAILLLKNPRGPERERVSSALWLCCWRIAGDNLCISGSGPVKDSSPSPSRLCQKHRLHYKPRKFPLLFALTSIHPIILSFPDLISLCWSKVFPSLQAQGHQHTLFTLHDASLHDAELGFFCLQPRSLPTQSLVLMRFLSFSHSKEDTNLAWELSPQTFVLFSELNTPILSCCSEVTQVEQKEQHHNKMNF